MEHYIQVIFVLALAKYCLKAAMTGRLWVMAAYAAVAAVVALVLYPAVITRPVTIVAGLLADRRLVTDGAVAELGETTLRVFPPLGAGGSNEEGLSVLGSAGEFDVLVTGDMNAAVERRLVKYGNLPETELLVVGHHGSGYSTSGELLQTIQPQWAVISVGYNTYGHPAEETLARLAQYGCDIYRTDWSGTVTITAE